MLGIHLVQEVQEGSSILRHSIVRPGCELELDDPPRIEAILFQMLWKREREEDRWVVGGGGDWDRSFREGVRSEEGGQKRLGNNDIS